MPAPISKVKILSPQNGGFIRAFWLVADSCGKEFRAVAGCANCGFFSTKFAKTIISRLKVEKTFCKEEKPIPVGFFTKSNSSKQNMYRNRRVEIYFQRCCATRPIKTKHERSRQTQTE
jgi:hypothetical protein